MIVPSRRQQAINANMQARIATIKPQLDEVNAKYKDDFMKLSQEKAVLFRKAGIRHSAQMGGCLLLFAQMPILMGLYFCLQESIFFRLEPFLWMPNLAAPDMTKWWGEHVPLISTPSARFGSFSFLYLGPYFNLLPLFAVILFYVQQKLTMPPPTDEMQETQQKMMKYMLAFSALFFYKVAAGLCVYFIVSGLWSLLERKLVPKPKIDEERIRRSLDSSEAEEKPKGWLGRKIAEAKEKMEEMQKQAETTRQIRNEPKAAEPQNRNERRAMNKKKKR
jgi:YidC/Oxa1 family membrane protein insertase